MHLFSQEVVASATNQSKGSLELLLFQPIRSDDFFIKMFLRSTRKKDDILPDLYNFVRLFRTCQIKISACEPLRQYLSSARQFNCLVIISHLALSAVANDMQIHSACNEKELRQTSDWTEIKNSARFVVPTLKTTSF